LRPMLLIKVAIPLMQRLDSGQVKIIEGALFGPSQPAPRPAIRIAPEDEAVVDGEGTCGACYWSRPIAADSEHATERERARLRCHWHHEHLLPLALGVLNRLMRPTEGKCCPAWCSSGSTGLDKEEEDSCSP
jgi:hypothetical protein